MSEIIVTLYPKYEDETDDVMSEISGINAIEEVRKYKFTAQQRVQWTAIIVGLLAFFSGVVIGLLWCVR